MSIFKSVGVFVIATAAVFVGTEYGEQLSVPGVHSMIPRAEAIVGRPLTPISYAGVARRSVRRHY